MAAHAGTYGLETEILPVATMLRFWSASRKPGLLNLLCRTIRVEADQIGAAGQRQRRNSRLDVLRSGLGFGCAGGIAGARPDRCRWQTTQPFLPVSGLCCNLLRCLFAFTQTSTRWLRLIASLACTVQVAGQLTHRGSQARVGDKVVERRCRHRCQYRGDSPKRSAIRSLVTPVLCCLDFQSFTSIQEWMHSSQTLDAAVNRYR